MEEQRLLDRIQASMEFADIIRDMRIVCETLPRIRVKASMDGNDYALVMPNARLGDRKGSTLSDLEKEEETLKQDNNNNKETAPKRKSRNISFISKQMQDFIVAYGSGKNEAQLRQCIRDAHRFAMDLPVTWKILMMDICFAMRNKKYKHPWRSFFPRRLPPLPPPLPPQSKGSLFSPIDKRFEEMVRIGQRNLHVFYTRMAYMLSKLSAPVLEAVHSPNFTLLEVGKIMQHAVECMVRGDLPILSRRQLAQMQQARFLGIELRLLQLGLLDSELDLHLHLGDDDNDDTTAGRTAAVENKEVGEEEKDIEKEQEHEYEDEDDEDEDEEDEDEEDEDEEDEDEDEDDDADSVLLLEEENYFQFQYSLLHDEKLPQ
jgi:hypothetical protein